jgi:multiple sugar transport system substrate-binding protein
MKKPRFGIVVLSLLVCGCRSDPNAHKIKIRYMAWGNPEQMALEEQLCQQFNLENQDLFVKFLKVPGTAYSNKSIVMLASDTAPDVLRVDHYNFASYQKKNFLLDLTDLTRSDPTWNEKDFFPQTTDECKINGRIYGLNVLFGGNVIYYNKTMMSHEGVEDPYVAWQHGRWNYQTFVDTAVKLTKKDQNGKSLQFGTAIPQFPSWTPLVYGFGGDFLTPDHKKSLLSDPKTIAGLQFIADLRYKFACAPTPAQGANSAFTFESGKLGMTFDWMGMTPRYRKAIKDFEWDVVPIPVGPESGQTIVKGNQLVIPKNCKNPKEAWRFARFITSPKIEQLLYVKNRRCFPTRVAVANSKEFLDDSTSPTQIHIFLDAVRGGRQLPIDDRWSEWTTTMNNELDFLWNGRERDANKVAIRAANAVDKVLSEEPGW